MQPNKEHIRLAQRILNENGASPKLLDGGDFFTESIREARKQLGHIKVKGRMFALRWVALVIQCEANKSSAVSHEIDQDAWWGPDTQDAAYRLMGEEHVGWRPDEKQIISSPDVPAVVRCWTPSDSQMIAKYGQPGTNQIMVTLPYAMRLDWDLSTTVTRATCHKLFAAPLTAALEAISKSYGLADIKRLHLDRFGGILNVRKKRGGTTWSTHAWGVALDLYPTGNQLAWKKDRAAFAREEYKPLREAMAAAGLMSLGTCFNFDWMHWQLNP